MIPGPPGRRGGRGRRDAREEGERDGEGKKSPPLQKEGEAVKRVGMERKKRSWRARTAKSHILSFFVVFAQEQILAECSEIQARRDRVNN